MTVLRRRKFRQPSGLIVEVKATKEFGLYACERQVDGRMVSLCGNCPDRWSIDRQINEWANFEYKLGSIPL